MQLTLTFLAVLTILELLLWLSPFWRWHKPLAAVQLVFLLAVTLVLAVGGLEIWVALLVFLNLYRMVNLLRLVKDRIQVDYLYHAARRTSLWLIGLQLVVFVFARLVAFYQISALSPFYWLAGAQVLGGLVLLASTSRHMRTTKPPKITATYTDHELPDLTVAIPARNETLDLEACLQSLVASRYPKLEILVLDDCSQTKRTPEIIRAFAQDGVRFIAGQTPPGHWLAKNYAYSRLAAEANGELFLFCGVDVRFEPDSLTLLVKTLLQKKKSMISVLPRNSLPKRQNIFRLLVQPNRYAWELALPRRLLKRPAVLSTCWLITRQSLRQAGSFEAVSHKIMPESYFARQAAADSDGYSFLRSDGMGIRSLKSFDEQLATAIRTRYPQLHRRPEIVALVGLAELGILLWPLIILIAALFGRVWPLAALSGLAYLIETVLYGTIMNLTYRKNFFGKAWLLPLAILQDIAILNYSMWQYEFRQVIWKGRNVCVPVMRAETKLPQDGLAYMDKSLKL
ncbi:MAG TPA: glycosyltransferase family A protein [Candidatus Dormibacteraeota bacterium]|nr:glycosyltransferase family A protein [Candidatus Dormibacteraeota bacterium]